MALNHSPEFCLKLIYRYLLKTGHFPGDDWGGHFLPQCHKLYTLCRSLLGDVTLPDINALVLVVSDKKIFHVFPI